MSSVVEPSSVDAPADLTARGHEGRFTTTLDGLLCCEVCGFCHEPDTAAVGEIDLDDDAVVVEAQCPCCQHQGTARLPIPLP